MELRPLDRWAPAKPVRLPRGEQLEIGRGRECGISDETVSRHHAVISCRLDSRGALVLEVKALKRVWVQLPGQPLMVAEPDTLGRAIKVR